MNTTHTSKTPWVICPRPNDRATLRLFCFPYSGGSTAIFSAWPQRLPAAIEVWPVQLPGRGARLAEPPFTRMTPLIEALASAIRPYLDRPFAFFGHSMGALVSFELARQLRRRYDLCPVHLIASGHRAPHVPDRDPPIYALPESEFLEELRRLNGTPAEVLEHAELRELVLPALRADFAVCETYVYTEDHPLECPIAALGGLQDSEVPREDLEAWRMQTQSAFSLRMLPGDHFFLNKEQPLLLQALVRELEPVLVLQQDFRHREHRAHRG